MYASLKELILIQSSDNDIGLNLWKLITTKLTVKLIIGLDFLVSHERLLKDCVFLDIFGFELCYKFR